MDISAETPSTATTTSASTAASASTSSLSTTSSRRATATTTRSSSSAESLLALTTPFVQPPGCSDIWRLTTITTRHFTGDHTGTTVVTAIVSDTDAPAFTQCQPSGWANVGTSSRFHFSPAVCPSDWTAYQVVATWSSATVVSRAWCCASGFSYLRADINAGIPFTVSNLAADPCWRSVSGATITAAVALVDNSNNSTTASTTTTVTYEGLQLHSGYRIQWAASDTATLSPVPPALPDACTLASWVPGTTLAADACVTPPVNDGPDWTPLIRFLEIGIPLIVVALIACCTCCCWGCRVDRRKRKQADAERLARAAEERERKLAAQRAQQGQVGDASRSAHHGPDEEELVEMTTQAPPPYTTVEQGRGTLDSEITQGPIGTRPADGQERA